MRRERALAVALGVLAVISAAVFLYQRGPYGSVMFPECMFHRMTGFYCPGCGMTRATHAALHGKVGEAFHFNPLGIVALPVIAGLMVMRVPAWLRDESRAPSRFQIGPRGALWIIGVVVGYWILRNIPAWPFTLLSPP